MPLTLFHTNEQQCHTRVASTQVTQFHNPSLSKVTASSLRHALIDAYLMSVVCKPEDVSDVRVEEMDEVEGTCTGEVCLIQHTQNNTVFVYC